MTISDRTTTAAAFDPQTARTWAEVDLGQIGRNARALQTFVGEGAFVMAVLKADAYGHGAERVARECARAGIEHFGVASVAEALELREAGIRDTDIYLLSPFLSAEAESIVRADLIPMVSSRAQLDALLAISHRARRPARCFLKVDTGMGRSGALPDDALTLWETVARGVDRNLRITGIATHFSSADEPDEDGEGITQGQIRAFFAFLAAVGDLNISGSGGGIWLSLANSPGTLRFPVSDLVPTQGVRGLLMRAGLLLYGIEPYRDAFADAGLAETIAPALTWKARVSLVRDLPAGATVGYGRTHTLTRDSRIATIAAGYADGLPRRLSNKGSVLIRGARYPILGRVSMDQCQIDLTGTPESILPGEIATLIGTDGAEHQTVLDLAETIETTPHEPTCALTKRVPRLYVRSASTPTAE